MLVHTCRPFLCYYRRRVADKSLLFKVYGIRTPTIDAEHFKKLDDLMHDWAKVMEFGSTPPVDIWPILKLVPEKLLGNWRSRAMHVHIGMNQLYGSLVKSVMHRQEEKGVQNSAVDRFLGARDREGLNMHQIYFLGGVTLEGGSEHSASVMNSCIQAMTHWPEVQMKAQAEIDAVVGENRSPSWSDYANLPYISSVVKESMRWRTVAPLAFPHCLSQGNLISVLRFGSCLTNWSCYR
jgi:cytochrome P450